MSERAALIEALQAYHPVDDAEARSRSFILQFLEAEPAPFTRATLRGHITASAFIVDDSCEHVLFVWHRKLKRWLQPGGHIEPEDLSPYHAAQREVREETGHEALVSAFGNDIFDVDVHPIPARKDEPAHQHLDIRYLFVAGPKIGEPDHELRWLAVRDAMHDNADASTVRAVQKIAYFRENGCRK